MSEQESDLQPSAGMLLISEPFLYDPNFKRTVVQLCENNEEGTIGFILNRLMSIRLTDVIDIETTLDIPLYIGGPVQNNTLHFIHRDPDIAESSVEIAEKVYWGGDFELVKEKITLNSLVPEDYRFFLGYSGWGIGQLEAEIKIKSWIVAPTGPEIIFERDNDKMWKTILNDLGGKYRTLANSPDNPQMN